MALALGAAAVGIGRPYCWGLAAFGQPGYTLSYSPTKHAGATGLCGLVLQQFTSSNKPNKAYAGYQPTCKKN